MSQTQLSRVIQLDRRDHAMPGMDRVYTHVAIEMREQLCAVLENLWNTALEQRHAMSERSAVPVLDAILTGRQCHPRKRSCHSGRHPPVPAIT
jgi:hypothetical protein